MGLVTLIADFAIGAIKTTTEPFDLEWLSPGCLKDLAQIEISRRCPAETQPWADGASSTALGRYHRRAIDRSASVNKGSFNNVPGARIPRHLMGLFISVPSGGDLFPYGCGVLASRRTKSKAAASFFDIWIDEFLMTGAYVGRL